jgi:hypothetical protein
MPICNPLIDPACVVGRLAHSVVSSAAGDVLSGLAQGVTDGIRWIVENTATWWVRIPSPDLSAEPAVTRLQQWLLPITAAVAVASVIAAGARMALTRRAGPLLDVTGGLLTLAATATLGVAVPTLLLKAGDAWSTWVLNASTGGQFAQRLINAFQFGDGAAPAVAIIFGVVAIVMSLVQAALMLFRQAALVILAGVLPLAAAGSIAPMTRIWIRKVAAWMLALICYKPAAAAVYATAFTMIGTGRGTRTVVMGFVMLALSVLMLPALMRFFTWTTGAIGTTGGGGQMFGAAAAGAIAVGALRSSGGASGGGSTAHEQAAFLASHLGASPGGTSPGGTSPGGASPGGAPPGGASGSPPTGPAAPGAPSPAAAGAAPAGSASTGAGAAPAGSAATAGGAASAGPTGASFAAGAQATQASAHLAADAMTQEEQQ